jgi:hypothetical protein
MSSYKYPVTGGSGGGSPYWKDAVANFAALPASGTVVGEVRLTQDTGDLYEWNGSAWVKILNASGTVIGPASAVDSQVVLFNGTTGKLLKASTDNGVAKLTSGVLSASSILNADVSASAAIVDTKLATISTAGKVSNSATTATNANTASAIVARDASGNFSAGTITATLSGSATNFSGSLSGDVTGTQSATAISSATVTGKLITGFVSGAGTVAATDTVLQAIQKLDGNVAGKEPTITTLSAAKGGLATDASAFTGVVKASSGVFSASSVVNADISASAGIVDTKLATISTAGKVSNSATTATNANTASAIVARDASGNFSAGTITASLTGNCSGSAATFTGSLSGDVTGTQSATAISAATVTGKLLTGYTSGAGTVAATDTILQGIQKLNGNTSGQIVTSSIVAVAGNVTLTNKAIHLVDTTAARSLTLPSPVSGACIILKDSTGSCATNNITLVRAASEKIETVAASYVLDTDLGSWTIVSNGTDWFII